MSGPPSRPLLVGERVVLAPLEEAHLDGPYISWLNDPEVCRYNSHGAVHYTRELALEFLASVAASGALVLAVHLVDGGAHIGNMSLQDFDHTARAADFAVLMGDRSVWGKGYATEAARLLVTYGFDTLDLHRVTAGTMVENEAMRRLADRLGMRQEGILRDAMFKDGAFHDVVLYAVLAEEWRATT